MEGGRLSRPRHCRKGVQPMPKAAYCSGCRDKHNWLQPLTPQSDMPPLNHCHLQRQMGCLRVLRNNMAGENQTLNHRVTSATTWPLDYWTTQYVKYYGRYQLEYATFTLIHLSYLTKQNSLTLPNAPYRCKLSVKALKWSYLPTRMSCNS